VKPDFALFAPLFFFFFLFVCKVIIFLPSLGAFFVAPFDLRSRPAVLFSTFLALL